MTALRSGAGARAAAAPAARPAPCSADSRADGRTRYLIAMTAGSRIQQGCGFRRVEGSAGFEFWCSSRLAHANAYTHAHAYTHLLDGMHMPGVLITLLLLLVRPCIGAAASLACHIKRRRDHTANQWHGSTVAPTNWAGQVNAHMLQGIHAAALCAQCTVHSSR